MLAAAAILLAEDEQDDIEDMAAFILLLEHRLRLRYRPKINKPSLTGPEHSAWSKVLSAQHNGTFIKVTGLDYPTFSMLLTDFQVHSRINYKRCKLDAAGHLGLALHYLSSTCDISCLCLIFGAVESVIYVSLDRALDTLDSLSARGKVRSGE